MAIIIRTEGAGAVDIPISEELIACGAEALVHGILVDESVFVEREEDLLGDFGVLFRGGPAEDIKVDLEPLVHVALDLVIFIADFFRCALLLESFHLGCCAVLVSPADV